MYTPEEIHQLTNEILQTKHPDLFRRWKAVAEKVPAMSAHLGQDSALVEVCSTWQAWVRALQDGLVGELERREAEYAAALEKLTEQCKQLDERLADDPTYNRRLENDAEFRRALMAFNVAGDLDAIRKSKNDFEAACEKWCGEKVTLPSAEQLFRELSKPVSDPNKTDESTD
jgi:hypothetical protein